MTSTGSYVVRIYGDDPQAGPGALLSEHEFTSEADARDFAWTCATSDRDARVTFNGTTLARYAVKDAAHGFEWTYTGITEADAERIAAQLSAHSHDTWTVERIG